VTLRLEFVNLQGNVARQMMLGGWNEGPEIRRENLKIERVPDLVGERREVKLLKQEEQQCDDYYSKLAHCNELEFSSLNLVALKESDWR